MHCSRTVALRAVNAYRASKLAELDRKGEWKLEGAVMPSALCPLLCPALALLAQPMRGDWETESGEARDESTHVRIDTDAILITV